MNKKHILTTALALLTLIMVLLPTSIHSQHQTNQIDRLYVFGDSLSDVGNVFKATNGTYPPSPPYYQGRYSNGRVWVEYLADKLGLTTKQNSNFAYGGATTASNGVYGVPGLLGQVYNFTKTNQQIDPNALYVLWAGANDYLYDTASPTEPVENLSQAIASLSKAGAKNILVANLPDLGNLPSTSNKPHSNGLTSLTNAHNLGLAKSLDTLSQEFGSDTQIIRMDVNYLYRDAIANPAKYGFTNVTGACLQNLATCENPDQFLFWDGIHPTTAAHQILAEAAIKALKAKL